MNTTGPRRLVRTQDRRLGGVCGGIAQYLHLDPTVVRLLTVIITLLGIGSPVLVYLIMWLIVPDE